MKNEAKKELIKTVIIIILAVALVGESVAFVVMKKQPSASDAVPASTVRIDATGIFMSLKEDASEMIKGTIEDIAGEKLDIGELKSSVRKLIYTDTIVSTIMSLAYPLLYNTLDNLGLMDFAEYVHLYPKGPQAASLLSGKGYTACDKSGARKDLGDVLNEVGDDWDYMNNKVKLDADDSDEEAVTLWYTIDWGVKDKDTFYKAMNNMGEILRGVLEVGLQGKELTINLNLADYLLNVDAVNVNLDAALVFNASDKPGYEKGIIYLFNMLGLTDGEYPTVAEYNAYTGIGDIWSGILEPVILAVEKVFDDPLNALTDMLVNFAVSADSGELCEGIKAIRMDADYHELASTFMGFEDGEVFNIGNAILDIIEGAGIKIKGSFNDILDSLLVLITGAPDADMPDMSVDTLKGFSTAATLPDGNTHYSADTQKTVDYLISYAVNENIVAAILNKTSLKDTAEEKELIDAVAKSKDGLVSIVKVLYSLIADKL